MKIHKISSKELTFKQVNEILTKGYKLELSADAIKRIQKCRDYLDKKMENPEKPIYGVTTGFGSLCDHSIFAGANVIMPNLTPNEFRENYLIYPDKACVKDKPDECHSCLDVRLAAIGHKVLYNAWGDSVAFTRKNAQK